MPSMNEFEIYIPLPKVDGAAVPSIIPLQKGGEYLFTKHIDKLLLVPANVV